MGKSQYVPKSSIEERWFEGIRVYSEKYGRDDFEDKKIIFNYYFTKGCIYLKRLESLTDSEKKTKEGIRLYKRVEGVKRMIHRLNNLKEGIGLGNLMPVFR